MLSATYELPFGRGKERLGSADPVTAAILGGWQFRGVFTRSTVLPFTVTTSGNITNAGGTDRPNRIGGRTLPSDRRSIDRWFDVRAFQVQPTHTYGYSGRNILSGPSQTNLDFTLAKAFRLSERFRLQFRAKAFNASNTPGFGLPGANINGDRVGQINSADEPRRVQFALKLLF